jgi:hypothetical protein
MKTEFENKINNLNIELSNLFTKWDTLVDDRKNELRRTVLEDINNNLLVRTYLLNLISTLSR